ncbi:MAG: hypothetical protein AAFQ98_17475 [Bacteroidota bacterium]
MVTTTAAGCRGIAWFDVSSGQRLIPEEIEMVVDKRLPHVCADFIQKMPSGEVFMVTGQRALTVVSPE